MGNIAIIKTGAAGDVVRTTSLLRALKGNIFWITAEKNKLLLPVDNKNLRVLSVKDAFNELKDINFELAISLEEDADCATLASAINAKEVAGVCFTNGKISYTDSSSHWFDMSRISKLGLAKANQLKAENTDSYQSHIFRMIGKKFNGEPYQIFTDSSIETHNELIGIERRTGTQWPDKQWWGYDELIRKLKSEGRDVKVFNQQTDVRDYLRDIARCSYIVSGDTLAMHIALAYQKKCTTVFNCTSPGEIYDYGLMKKIVSPLLHRFFYSATYDREAVESISFDEVYNSISI